MCGNLEDAIPIESKDAARAGFIEVLLENNDFGDTGMWVRINALNSPWVLDDLSEIIKHVGNKLDVIMIPKVEGPWDIHFVDQYVALLEAKYAIRKPILLHALLETAQGVTNVEAICGASPRMHGLSLGPADLAASRGMKTTRVGGGHPGYGVLADPEEGQNQRAFFQQDLWHYTVARMVDAAVAHGLHSFYGPFGDLKDEAACEAQFRNAFPDGLLGCLVAGTEPDRHRQARLQPRRQGSPVRQTHPRSDARWQRRGDHRRQDAGRRDLETGAGDRRPGATGGQTRSGPGGSLWPVAQPINRRGRSIQ
jgi:malyl-CoA/(S)-citramalyl-CoA lyase